MDAKITKRRLNILLSYDWIKIVAVAVAAILVWSLIFTMTATRITPAQQFTVINYTGTTASNGFNSYPETLMKKEVFSYDVLEVETLDMTTGKEYGSTLLQTRLSTNEGDALFVADIPYADEKYKDAVCDAEGNVRTLTYMEEFLSSYRYAAVNFDENSEGGGFRQQMSDYLDGYYFGDFGENNMDKEKVKSDFLARIDRLNDKRFKKNSEIEKGLESEYARIAGYRTAWLEFRSYLLNGYISLTETAVYQKNENGETEAVLTGTYGINLCPDERMESLKNDIYYLDAANENLRTARNINLVLLDIAGDKYAYSRFEGILFVNYLVRTHCSELNQD